MTWRVQWRQFAWSSHARTRLCRHRLRDHWLFASKHDRVLEVSVVHVNEAGLVEGQWDTLVNPGRDLGRQDIHTSARPMSCGHPRSLTSCHDSSTYSRDESWSRTMRVLISDSSSPNLSLLVIRSCQILSLCARCRLRGRSCPVRVAPWQYCCAAYDIEIVDAHQPSVDASAARVSACRSAGAT